MFKLLKKFFFILSNNQKRYLIYIVILSFVGALLEMISLGLLIPIIGLINSETSLNNFIVNNILVSFSLFLKKLHNNEVLVLVGLFFSQRVF